MNDSESLEVQIDTYGREAVVELIEANRRERKQREDTMRADPLYQRLRRVIVETIDCPPLGRPLSESIAARVYGIVTAPDDAAGTAV